MELTSLKTKNLNALLIRLSFLFIISITFTSFIFKRPKLSVVILVNDSNNDKSYYNSLSDLVYLKTKKKIKNFKIHHYSKQKDEESSIWGKRKRKVDYKPFNKSCDFSFCTSVQILIANYQSKENLIYTNTLASECDYTNFTSDIQVKEKLMDIANLNSIIEKNYDEITHKDDRTLFIIYNDPNEDRRLLTNDMLPEYNFSQNELIKLSPALSDEVEFVKWSGSEGINCDSCKSINYIADRSHQLVLELWDKEKCNHEVIKIDITVDNSEKNRTKVSHIGNNSKCLCSSSNIKQIKDVFGKINHPKYTDDIMKGDWKILSRESGGSVFDFITVPSCFPKYIVEIYDSNNKLVWKEIYDIDEVNEKSRNDLHRLYQNKFIFVLSLYEIKRLISRAEPLIIEITPVDENNKNCDKYRSPELIFSKCP